MTWVLRVVDVQRPSRWRWQLENSGERVVAEHDVDLDDDSAEYEAFTRLDRYLQRNAVPDDRAASEAAILDGIGAWIGEHVLGKSIGTAIVASNEDSFRVVLPKDAAFLLTSPLELAHVDGESLARREISFVYTWPGDQTADNGPITDALRILALFSMPSRTTPLSLRRERYELAECVRQWARQGKAVEIQALQYGVTRKHVRRLAERDPGWDVLHIAGHGEENGILLEKPDGSPDRVSTDELVKLLRPARRRLKLAVLGTCKSGATTTAEAMARLGLGDEDALDRAGNTKPTAVGLARGIVKDLGVTAVAMRYAVSDRFAIAFARELYPRLLEGMPVDRAVALAIPAAASDRFPALSLATPALFGAGGAAATMRAPDRRIDFDPRRQPMPGFPPEPERFVGRTKLMIEGSAALASRSRRAGVLLFGMAGVGKTTAATELAYQHASAFGGHAWWDAPDRKVDPSLALTDLAEALERQLPSFQMREAVASASTFRDRLPEITRLLHNEAILIVLNNVENLLTPSGTWRDPLWADLMTALSCHGGASRTVLTSRETPVGLDTARIPVLPVHGLTLPESVIFLHELDRLGALLHNGPGQASAEADHQLVRDLLQVVQGHPKLIMLAEAAAADPATLRERLRRTRGAHSDTARPDPSEDDLLDTLTTWSAESSARLPMPARVLAELLACLEEPDRQSAVVSLVWPRLWEDHDGQVPSVDTAIAALAAAALVEVEDGADYAVYRIHPAVAEAIRSATPEPRRAELDAIVGGLWAAICAEAFDREIRQDDASGTDTIVQAALSAAPYLLRRGARAAVVDLLTKAAGRDRSPITVRRMLSYLQQCKQDEPDPRQRLTADAAYAEMLVDVDPDEAETTLRALIEQAEREHRSDLLPSLITRLTQLLAQHGRAFEAADLADETTARGGTSETGQLARAAFHLMARARTLPPAQALDQARALLERLDAAAHPEGLAHWNSIEMTLDVACNAANHLHNWEQALAYNRRMQDSERRRGAGAHERATTRLKAANLLSSLSRYDDAEEILLACQAVFERSSDIANLGSVFSARGKLDALRDRFEQAANLEKVALRYIYPARHVHNIASSHHNLGWHLRKSGGDKIGAAAHMLAATLLWSAGGHADKVAGERALSLILPRPAGHLRPADVGELTARVERVPGVRFGALFATLLPSPGARAALLTSTADLCERYFVVDPTAVLDDKTPFP